MITYILMSILLVLSFPIKPQLFLENSSTQRKSDNRGFKVNICEENIARLDSIHNQIKEEEKVTFISYLGNKEADNKLHYRRLQNARRYFSIFLGDRRVLTVKGSGRKTRGRIEAYLQGKLIEVFYLNQNEDFRVGSCDDTDQRNYKLFDLSRKPQK